MRPTRILLMILSTFIVLGAVCVLFAGKSEVVRVPELSSVVSLPQWPQQADTLLAEADMPVDTSALVTDTTAIEATNPVEPQQADSTVAKPVPTELPKALSLHLRLLHTHKSDSVSCAHFSWLLMHARFYLCPPIVCFPSPVEVL